MRSFAEDRRLIQLAGSLKSLEAVSKRLGRNLRPLQKWLSGWEFP
jgi:hypothetical protein